MRAGQALSLQGVVKRFDLGGRSLTVLPPLSVVLIHVRRIAQRFVFY